MCRAERRWRQRTCFLSSPPPLPLSVPCELPAPPCSQSRLSHGRTDLNINARRPSLCETSKSYLLFFFFFFSLLIPGLLWMHKAWASSMSELIMALSHFKAPLWPLNTYWCPLCVCGGWGGEEEEVGMGGGGQQRWISPWPWPGYASAGLVGTSSMEKEMKYKWPRSRAVVKPKASGGGGGASKTPLCALLWDVLAEAEAKKKKNYIKNKINKNLTAAV